MIKFAKLFDTVTTTDTFLNAITPGTAAMDKLIEAKNAIRDYLLREIEAASVNALGLPKMISPRFRTQGSQAYRTSVFPYYIPWQQLDWDFGVYLPAEFLKEMGPPVAMAKAYFLLVENALKRLAKEKGWSVVEGRRAKKTCIRVQIDNQSHIDVPLYAAPAQKFNQIVEARVAKSLDSKELAANYLRESAEFGELIGQDWDDMDDIYLAQRDGTWKKSDPARVARWYRDQLALHSDNKQLERACKYAKAWRDFIWREDGPSSVLIQIIVTQGFRPHYGRDDLVLEQAADHLCKALLGEVREEGIDDGEEDFNKLSHEERIEASRAAGRLRDAINACRANHSGNAAAVIQSLRAALGDRIPYNLAAIEVVAVAADTVRQTPAKITAQPQIDRSEAG